MKTTLWRKAGQLALPLLLTLPTLASAAEFDGAQLTAVWGNEDVQSSVLVSRRRRSVREPWPH